MGKRDDRLASFPSARPFVASPQDLFSIAMAGIFISGDSGFGKSNMMKFLMQQLARSGEGFMFISPHDEDPRAMRDWCLAQRPSIRDRLLYIEPADTSRVVCINPLSVKGGDKP